MQTLTATGLISLLAVPAILGLAIAYATTGSAYRWIIELIDDAREASLISIISVGAGILLAAKMLMTTHLLAAGTLSAISLAIIFGGILLKRW